MTQSKWSGMYEYKGFMIWCPNDDGTWIAEPSWSIEAIENYKWKIAEDFSTIAKAKRWVQETGIHLIEEDYLN